MASVGGTVGVPATAGADDAVDADDAQWLTDDQFASGDFRPSWLIKNVLTRGEPCGIGAPMKTLKTSIAVDMAISLATGTDFLEKFSVPHPATVAVVSGESGKPTLQKIRERVLTAKGYDLDYRTDRLHWRFDTPCLSDVPKMAVFVAGLAKRNVEVGILDPLYLMLGDVDPANLFAAGGVLRNIGQMMMGHGITPVILHHARKILAVGQPMELPDLSHSGFAEFVRQYILINRMEHFQHDGRHSLNMRIGGSAGHGGEYLIDVDEGTLQEDFSGRYWSVRVTNKADMPKATAEDRDAKKTAERKAKNAAKIEKFLKELDAELATGVPAVTANKFRTIHGWQYADLKAVTECLMMDGVIELHPFDFEAGNNAKQQTTGYRRPVPKTQSELEFPNSQFENEQPVFSGAQPAELAVPGVGGEQPVEQPVWLSPLKGDTNGQPAVPQHHREKQKPKGKKNAKTGRQKKTGCSPDAAGAA